MRHVITIAAAASLLLCIATAALWVRSYWFNDGFVYAHAHSTSVGRVGRGKVFVMTLRIEPKAKGFERLRWAASVDWTRGPALPGTFGGSIDQPTVQFLGFHFFTGTQDYLISKAPDWKSRAVPYQMAVIPIWFLFAATFAAACPLLLRARKWLPHRPGAGHCGACGYNLTGNTSGVCPECGARIR